MGMLLDDVSPCRTAPHHGHILHDNLDDRREVYRLLHRLSPRRRVAFLEDACRRASLGHSGVRPVVQSRTRQLAEQARWDSAADERLTLEVYWDLWQLDVNFRVDFDNMLRRLEEWARGPCGGNT